MMNRFSLEHYFEILYVSVARYLPDFTLFKIPKNEQSNKTSKLNSEAKSKSANLQIGLKSPNINKKSLLEGIWSKKVSEHAFLKSHILPQNLLISQNCD